MLCRACDEYRFPSIHDIRSSKTSRQPASAKVSAGKKDVQSVHIIPTLASGVGPTSTVACDDAGALMMVLGPSAPSQATVDLKGKERKERSLYSAIYCDTLKALRRGSHSFTCK